MEFPPLQNLVSATFSQMNAPKDNPTNAPAQAAQPVSGGEQSNSDGSSGTGLENDFGSQSAVVGKVLDAKA